MENVIYDGKKIANLKQWNGEDIIEILETINFIIEYDNMSLSPEDNSFIKEALKKMRKLAEEIDEHYDNSY